MACFRTRMSSALGARRRIACEDRAMAVVAVRYSDDPSLWQRIGGLSAEVWPEYNLHGDVLNVFWNRL